MKSFCFLLTCLLSVILLPSCASRVGEDSPEKEVTSIEVRELEGDIASIDVMLLQSAEPPHKQKTADSAEEFDTILDAIEGLALTSPEDANPESDTHVKIVLTLAENSEKVFEYDKGTVRFEDQEYRCLDNGKELTRLYNGLDGEELLVDENGSPVPSEEENKTDENKAADEKKAAEEEQGDTPSQPAASQQAPGNETKTNGAAETGTNDPNNAPLGSPENPYAVEPQDNGGEAPLGSPENPYAVEPQDDGTEAPLGSAENPYAVEPQAPASEDDPDYKWSYKGEPMEDVEPVDPPK